MGDYREFEEEALKNPEVYFENGDGIHFRTSPFSPLSTLFNKRLHHIT